MPALGMNQVSGILVVWLKAEGDEVKVGEPLMVVETDKTTVEIEAPASGILANVTASAGDSIPVGEVIAVILAPGESAPSKPASTEDGAVSVPAPQRLAPGTVPTASPVAARIAAEHGVDLAQVPASGGRISKEDVLTYISQYAQAPPAGQPSGNGKLLPASPKARCLAGERGIDLAGLSGSGPGGAVLAADVLAARATPQAVSSSATIALEIGNMWRVMAQRLTESWTSVPHFYLVREVDATQLIAWHAVAQEGSAEKITFTDLLTRLVAVALRKHPRVNGSWQEETIVLNEDINVGLAVAVEEGLVVPVIHQADKLGLVELAQRRKEIVERAQSGHLRLEDLQGGTFTISNLGMCGVDVFNAIVNPPQAAILAVGRIADRVVPVNGEPAIRPMMILSLSFDHRVVDGARGAQFLETLVGLIGEPKRLIG